MGAMPVAGWVVAGAERPQPRRDGTPERGTGREALAWGYLVHPSLMPTVFARGESAADRDAGEATKVVARKV